MKTVQTCAGIHLEFKSLHRSKSGMYSLFSFILTERILFLLEEMFFFFLTVMSHSTVFNCEKPEDVHTPYHTEWSRVKCNLNVKCVRIVVGITCAHMHTQILSLLCSVTFVRMSLLRIVLQECFCNFQCELIHYWLSIHSIIAQKLLAIFSSFPSCFN